MATKNKLVQMNNMQLLAHVVRMGAPPNVIVSTAKTMLQNCMDHDEYEGPIAPKSIDAAMAIWTLATAYAKLHTENETLKRRLRRDNRKTANKPAGELLKKTPEVAFIPPQVS